MWSRVAGLVQTRVQAISQSTVPRVIRLLNNTSLLRPSSTLANYRVFQLKSHHPCHLSLHCTRSCASNANTPVGHEEGGYIPGHFQIMFTCNVCEMRTSKRISKQAYYNGIVIIRCTGCDNHHLIADNYNWFGQGKRCVNDVIYEMLFYCIIM